MLKDLPAGTTVRKLTSIGTFMLAGVTSMVGGPYGFHQVLVIVEGHQITIADLEGEILTAHTRPAPGSPTSTTADPAARRPRPTVTDICPAALSPDVPRHHAEVLPRSTLRSNTCSSRLGAR